MRELALLYIVVVDDDDDARELMQAVLEQRGATVATADSVEAACAKLAERRPDVIVSDIAMPEEDGLAFARRVRSMPAESERRMPMIAVSAFVASADRMRALAAGFDRYLFKPIDFDELCRAIESLVTRDDQATA